MSIRARARELATKGPPPLPPSSLAAATVGHDALAIALLCVLTADLSAPDVVPATLWRAAAHSGDSDSTAAIAGNILGERFNGRFRDECLIMEWFRSRTEAMVVIETWRDHYNSMRPHSSFGYLTPFAFKASGITSKPATRDQLKTGQFAPVVD